MMREELMTELLSYLITSSANFKDEPHYYGQLRLIEASERLINIMLLDCPDNEELKQIADRIEKDKRKGSTDISAFQKMLDESVMMLLDYIDK